MAATIRILLADDSEPVRDSLRMALQTEPDFEVVGEATTGEQAVALAQQLLPDVIVMDIEMPSGGIDATRQISAMCPQVKVIGLTIYDSQEPKAKQLVAAGAVVLVTKGTPFQALVSAIRTAAGKRPAHPGLRAAM